MSNFNYSDPIAMIDSIPTLFLIPIIHLCYSLFPIPIIYTFAYPDPWVTLP